MEPHEILFEENDPPNKWLCGLARQCPRCNIVAHYKVKSRKLTGVECPDCGHNFKVQKYRRGERPK